MTEISHYTTGKESIGGATKAYRQENPLLSSQNESDNGENSGNTSEEFEKPNVDLKPVLIVIGCAVIGLIVGISLSDGRGSEELVSWINLPGELFIRSLKAIVLPLVFVNIILSVVDMIRAGKANTVGVLTIGLYLLTTFIASLEGLLFVLMFQGTFSDKNVQVDANTPEIMIKCPLVELGTQKAMYLTQNMTCETKGDIFLLDNPNGFLKENVDENAVADDISFSDTLQDGIFRKMISENIVLDFVNANFVGVIVFAILVAASSQSLKHQPKVFVALLEESNRIFLKIIDWIIFLTPIAVLSLIAGSLGAEDELSSVFADIGLLMACSVLAFLTHYVTYQLLYLFFVRQSPIPYAKHIFPAQVFAFASASSAATLPISIKCVEASKEVPSSVGNFVLSMGSTINMDGGAIYFPTAIVFLAIASGLEDELNAASYFLIILLSTLGSAGAAPVPSASLVLIITAYNTVFDTAGTPEAFSLILGVDWLMDRFRTLLNITGDTYMARIVTAASGASFDDDVLSQHSE